MDGIISPDGSKMVFTSDRTGDYEIYTMNLNGTDVINLTDNPASWDANPCWSPDGSKIVFSSDRAGNLDIYAMDADGKNLTRLTYEYYQEFYPRWSQ
jgi:TolB protein